MKMDIDISKLVKELEEIKESDWNKSEMPIEIDKSEYDELEGKYIFRNEAEKIKNLIANMKNDDNKIIGVIGGRGSGKTSLLKTIRNILGDDYISFNIVDPSIFNNSLSILEILISSIYEEIKEEFDFNSTSAISSHAKLLKDLKSFTRTLANLRKKDTYFKENNPSIDILEDIGNRMKFDEKLNRLLEDFKNLYKENNGGKVKELVLIIDDIDLLDNSIIYEMINNLQNFLSGKLILILGYREEQLLESIISGKILENQSLLNYEQIGIEEIKKQASDLLEKLIPFSKKVYLNKSDENLDIFGLLSSITNNSFEDYPNIKELGFSNLLVELIEYRINLNILPISSSEKSGYIFPSNIRGIMQILKILIFDMKKTGNEENAHNIYLKNLRIYRAYLNSRIEHIMSQDKLNVLKEWEGKDPKIKNHYIYQSIFNEILNKGTKTYEIDKLDQILNGNILDISQMEAQNICIGDIIDILDIYKSIIAETDMDHYYIYIIKVLYSLELLEKLFEYINYMNSNRKNIVNYIDNIQEYNMLDPSIRDYLNLVNVKIIPESYSYLRSEKSIRCEYNKDYIDIFTCLTYTDFTVNGDLRGENRKKYTRSTNSFGFNFNRVKYRDFFNPFNIGYNNKVDNGYILELDPYSILGKYTYVNKAIENMLDDKKEDMAEYYLFYSLFDVELFMSINYYRSSEKYPVTKIFRKVNDLFSGEITIAYETKVIERLSRRSFVDIDRKLINKFVMNNISKDKKEINSYGDLLSPYGYFDTVEYFLPKISKLFGEDIIKSEEIVSSSNREKIIELLTELLEEDGDNGLKVNEKFKTEASKNSQLKEVSGLGVYDGIKKGKFSAKVTKAKKVIKSNFRDIDEIRTKENILNLLDSTTTSNVRNRYLLTLIFLLKDS